MNRDETRARNRAAMLKRLDEMHMREHDRARARSALLQAERIVDLCCDAGAWIGERVGAALRVVGKVSRSTPAPRHEPGVHRR